MDTAKACVFFHPPVSGHYGRWDGVGDQKLTIFPPDVHGDPHDASCFDFRGTYT